MFSINDIKPAQIFLASLTDCTKNVHSNLRAAPTSDRRPSVTKAEIFYSNES